LVSLGPWISDDFDEKNITSIKDRSAIIKYLIDALNDLLIELSETYLSVYYVDLHGTLCVECWEDDIHPSKKGAK